MEAHETSLPFVIDLDGTLIKTDSIDETLLDALRANPLSILRWPLRLIHGRAAFKSFLAEKSPLNVDHWPVREDFLKYVNQQAQSGRKIVLATAANQLVAGAIVCRFPFISEVITSTPDVNLKGRVKAARLCERFPQGFIYAGNSAADMAVWRKAAGAVVVNAPLNLVRRVKQLGEPVAVFPHQLFSITILRRSLRLHQWVKNALIFVPLVLGGKSGDATAWLKALMGFIAFGLVASATYVINDLWDLPNDRRDPSKRTRPLASGGLSIRAGLLLSLIALAAGFTTAAWVGLSAVATLAIYLAATLSYSFFCKRVPILDVFVLASLFTFRLWFGILLTDARWSPWLLVFSMFVFLSLSMAKRHTELLGIIDHGEDSTPGRGYRSSDAPLTLGLGLATMLGAVLIMILYLIDYAFPAGLYPHPVCLWMMPPILFLFLGRIWIASQRGELHYDPVAFALKDRVSLVLGLLMLTSVAAALAPESWP